MANDRNSTTRTLKGRCDAAGASAPSYVTTEYDKIATRFRMSANAPDAFADPRWLASAVGRACRALPHQAPVPLVVTPSTIAYWERASSQAWGWLVYQGVAQSLLIKADRIYQEADILGLAAALAVPRPMLQRFLWREIVLRHRYCPADAIRARAAVYQPPESARRFF